MTLPFGALAAPHNIHIKGTVTDASDQSALPGVSILLKGTKQGTVTDTEGNFTISVPSPESVLVFQFIGFITEEVLVGNKTTIDVALQADVRALEEVVVIGYAEQRKAALTGAIARRSGKRKSAAMPAINGNMAVTEYDMEAPTPEHNTEGYTSIQENSFLTPDKNPLSTFSIDVDAASYSNLRRFINNGQKPPIDAVRIEEMINYFDYDYPQPENNHPFSVTTELAACPWNTDNKLLHIGLQGKIIPTENLPASNLVFLIDVSGSMSDVNKLPLLKSAFKMLVDNLREVDRVSIVVYAGAAGMVLPPTPGHDKKTIMQALDRLEAGGSTAGSAGLKLAYEIAEKNLIEDGNNRIILATDGDFNIGPSSNAEMERMIEKEREKGIFMTVLGFGMGNYKDDKMEIIANKGNGNYAYIDNLQEAKKVLVGEFGGTLFTIAKDVKIQIEFNPENVAAYRLIGYENRKLAAEDFNDDKKDAGELGSGHTVTALYEIVPAGMHSQHVRHVDPLKYQKQETRPEQHHSDDLLTLKLRYKAPDGDESKLISSVVKDEAGESETSENFRWSAAVAGVGMLLRESEYAGKADISMLLKMANEAKGTDEEGYRSEFIRLMKSSSYLAKR